MLGAYLLAHDRLVVRRAPVRRDRRRRRAQPRGRRAGLRLPDAQDDRRDGARRRAHHRRARHPAARADGADLVGAAAISRAGARLLQSGAGAARRRAHLDLRGDPRRQHRVRLRRAVRVPALRALGRAHARRRAESAARRAARHQPARRLCAGLGPFDADRLARRHADRARLRPDQHHGDHRAQGVSGRAGRRPRQPRGRAARRADHRRRRGAVDPVRRSAAVRRGAVPGADR